MSQRFAENNMGKRVHSANTGSTIGGYRLLQNPLRLCVSVPVWRPTGSVSKIKRCKK
jgi:hypothetical protein